MRADFPFSLSLLCPQPQWLSEPSLIMHLCVCRRHNNDLFSLDQKMYVSEYIHPSGSVFVTLVEQQKLLDVFSAKIFLIHSLTHVLFT